MYLIAAIVLDLPAFINCFTGSLSLEMLCPSQDLCNRTLPVLPYLPHDSPCCTSCSCEPDCVNIGNCCPDMEDPGPSLRPLECLHPVVNPTQELLIHHDLKIHGYFEYIEQYFAVVTCPDNEVDVNLRFKCEQKVPEYPEDLRIVANSRGHLYKNVFCARCNGETSFTSWNIRMSCSNSEVGYMYTHLRPFSLYKECMFIASPSEPGIHLGSRCFSSFKSCNETGLWRIYHPYIEEQCARSQMYFRVVSRNRLFYQMYKNVYCFLCNSFNNDSHLEPFCNLSPAYLNENDMPMFSAIIKGFPTSVEPDQEMVTCNHSDVFDPYFKRCRSLLCPNAYTMPIYGQCQEYFDKIFGETSAIVFTVEAILRNVTEVQRVYEKRNDIITFIEEKLKLSWCSRCSQVIWAIHEETRIELAFRVQYQTTLSCDMLFIQSAVMRYVNANIARNIAFDDMQLTFSVLPGDTDLLHYSFDSSTFNACHGDVVNFSFPALCPRLEFSQYEYQNLTSNMIISPELITIDDEVEEKRYFICSEDYFAISAASLSLLDNAFPLMLFIHCVVIYISL